MASVLAFINCIDSARDGHDSIMVLNGSQIQKPEPSLQGRNLAITSAWESFGLSEN